MNIKVICIICGVLLLVAIPSWLPYGFYTFLRLIICAASIYLAFAFYKLKFNGWVLVFGSIALLFNPIIPIYLNKESWIVIDFIGIILFFIAAYSKK